MALTSQQMQRLVEIDTQAQQIFSEGGKEALLVSLHDFMGDLKNIMDSSTHEELDYFCQKYDGFYRCMKLLEDLARGIQEGKIPVL